MKTFNDVKIGDFICYGRLLDRKWAIDEFKVRNIQKTLNDKIFSLVIVKTTERFQIGFKYALYLDQKELTKTDCRGFFINIDEENIEKLKIQELSHSFRSSNLRVRALYRKQ